MTLRVPAIAVLMLAGACKPAAEKTDEKADEIRGEVYDAVCRLYVEEACIQQQQDEGCGFISFPTIGDCKNLIAYGAAGNCDEGFDAAVVGAEAEIGDCIAALDAFECGGSEEICVEQDGAYLYNLPGCETANEIWNEHCESDSG
jgi:hypothetical protein